MVLEAEGCVLQLTQKQRIDAHEYIRIYYDADWEGLFTDLHVSQKNYLASQISLPMRTISSIIIPKGYQVKLCTEDNFDGWCVYQNFDTLSANKDFRYNYINDNIVSLEILKRNTITEAEGLIYLAFSTFLMMIGAVGYL